MLKETGKRLTSKTPPYHKKLRNLAGVLVAVAAGLLAAQDSLELSKTVVDVCTYVIVICSAMGITAQTAKQK